MTISSFMGLQTALRGLLAEQAAIDTTGHNIANANTPGYSRQTADLDREHAADDPGVLERHRRRRPARHRRRRHHDQPDPQHVPRHPVPVAEHDLQRRVDPRRNPRSGPDRPRRAVRSRPREASCRRSGTRGAMSRTPPRASRRARRVDQRRDNADQRFNQFDAQLSTIQSQAATQYAHADRHRPARCRATRTRSPRSTSRSAPRRPPGRTPTTCSTSATR